MNSITKLSKEHLEHLARLPENQIPKHRYRPKSKAEVARRIRHSSSLQLKGRRASFVIADIVAFGVMISRSPAGGFGRSGEKRNLHNYG
jgi:hypothetical protein